MARLRVPLLPVACAGLFVATIVWLALDQARAQELGVRAAYPPLVALAALLTSYSWTALRRQEREADRADALAAWGAERGLGAVATLELDDSVLAERGLVPPHGAVRGTPLGDRAGLVAHVRVPLRAGWLAGFLPMLGPLADEAAEEWTVATAALTAEEAAPFRRVRLAGRDLLDATRVAAVRDAVGELRRVELESVELHDRYRLEVHDDADDVAVRAAFTPARVVALVERAVPVLVELRGRVVSVARPGFATAHEELDALLADLQESAAAFAPTLASASTWGEQRSWSPVRRPPRWLGRSCLPLVPLMFAAIIGLFEAGVLG